MDRDADVVICIEDEAWMQKASIEWLFNEGIQGKYNFRGTQTSWVKDKAGKQGRDDASGQLVDREGEGERKIQATQKSVPGLDNVEDKIENDHANDPRHSSAEVPKRDNENISLGSKHTAGDQGQCASSGYSSGSSADGQSKPGTAKGTSERRSHDAKSAE